MRKRSCETKAPQELSAHWKRLDKTVQAIKKRNKRFSVKHIEDSIEQSVAAGASSGSFKAMKYPSGEDVRLGDRVSLWADADGVVVCSLDTSEYSTDYPEKQWSYLKSGVLVLSPQAGLIHYIEPESSLTLLERGMR